MNPEEGTEVGALNMKSTGKDNEFGNRAHSLSDNCVPGVVSNADASTAKSDPSLN